MHCNKCLDKGYLDWGETVSSHEVVMCDCGKESNERKPDKEDSERDKEAFWSDFT